MKKTQYSVVLTLTDASTLTLADTDGYGAGSAAYSQLSQRKDINVRTEADDVESITIVPYQAIVKAVVTPSQVTVDAPTDAFCEAEEP